MRRPQPFTKFGRFIIVGGFGFIVDAGFLALMISRGADPFTARVISIALAMLVTWRLNRALTFGRSRGSQLGEAGRYFSVAVAVAALNYALYAGILISAPACPPILATAISTCLCTLASFMGYGRFAFRTR